MEFFLFVIAVTVALFLYDRSEKNRKSDKTQLENHLRAVSRRLDDREESAASLAIRMARLEKVLEEVLSAEKEMSSLLTKLTTQEEELLNSLEAITARISEISLRVKAQGQDIDEVNSDVFSLRTVVQAEVMALKASTKPKKGPKWKSPKRK